MNPTLAVFSTIIVIFFLALGVKLLLKRQFCVICASVSITWVSYLVLEKLGYFQDKILLGILVGQTVVGIYYLLERKSKAGLLVFRLPFLLSLTWLAYFLLLPSREAIFVLWLLGGLWILFLVVHIARGYPALGRFVEKIIACCKNW